MTTMNDDSRLGRLEGRVDEHSGAIQENRQDTRSGFQRVDARFDQTNSRIDRLFLALLGIGVAQIGILITLLLRGG